MENYLLVEKKIGETPLEVVERVKRDLPEISDAKIGYAGRLDPMARGLLLLLLGEENKNQAQYFGLPKTYEVTILFGVSTDTGDILGIINNNYQLEQLNFDKSQLLSYVGKFNQPYPLYSSKPVDGKPLFAWVREGLENEIEVPLQKGEIYNVDLIKQEKIKKSDLEKMIFESIALVKGDFRQEDTLIKWKQELNAISNNYYFNTLTLRVDCSSGTYMRSLAQKIGKDMGVPALALDIYRTRIGDFTLPAPN